MLTVSLHRENSHPDQTKHREYILYSQSTHSNKHTENTGRERERENSHQNQTLHREYTLYAQSMHSNKQTENTSRERERTPIRIKQCTENTSCMPKVHTLTISESQLVNSTPAKQNTPCMPEVDTLSLKVCDWESQLVNGIQSRQTSS